MSKLVDAVSTLPRWSVTYDGEVYVTIISPFDLGDGELLELTVVSGDNLSFTVSDSVQAAMCASNRGLDLTEELIQELNNTYGIEYAHVDDSGEIIAKHRDLNLLHKAVEDAAKLALAMVFRCPDINN